MPVSHKNNEVQYYIVCCILFCFVFPNKPLLRFNTPETVLLSLLCADDWRADLTVKVSSQRPLHIRFSTSDCGELQNTGHLRVFFTMGAAATKAALALPLQTSSQRIVTLPDTFVVPSIRLPIKQPSEPVSLFTMETQRYFNSAGTTGFHYCTFYQVSSVTETFV